MSISVKPGPPEGAALAAETPVGQAGGCKGCWAAGYCIAYAPASVVQPPPACPLLPKRPARPRPRSPKQS